MFTTKKSAETSQWSGILYRFCLLAVTIRNWVICYCLMIFVVNNCLVSVIIMRSHRRQRSVASNQSCYVHDGEPWTTWHEYQEVCRRNQPGGQEPVWIATTCNSARWAGVWSSSLTTWPNSWVSPPGDDALDCFCKRVFNVGRFLCVVIELSANDCLHWLATDC